VIVVINKDIGHIAKASENQTFSRVKICSGHKMQVFRASEWGNEGFLKDDGKDGLRSQKPEFRSQNE
jgi:hypothetical protein